MIHMELNDNPGLVKVLTDDVLRRISLILTDDITDAFNIIFVYTLFDELPRPAQEYVISHIYPKGQSSQMSYW